MSMFARPGPDEAPSEEDGDTEYDADELVVTPEALASGEFSTLDDIEAQLE